MQTGRNNLRSDFTPNLGPVLSKKHHATFPPDLDFIEHFFQWKMFYQEKCFSSTKACVCVTQNMVSFASQVLPQFASTLRSSSVKQAGGCQLQHAAYWREAKSETTQCKKNVEKYMFAQIPCFHNGTGSKLLLEVLIFIVRMLVSLLGGSLSPAGLCAGEGRSVEAMFVPCRLHLVVCFHTGMMLGRH